MKKLTIILALMCVGTFVAVVNARPPSTGKKERTAITRAITIYIRKGGENPPAFAVKNIDVQGTWAMAFVKPKSDAVDAADVLLRKQKGRWKVLALGTGMGSDTGEHYGVPQYLQKRWRL